MLRDGTSMPPRSSNAQQGIWISERADGGGTAYHIPLAIWLDGPRLDVPALRQACADVAGRHDVLAAVVRDVDGAVCLGTAIAGPPVAAADLAGRSGAEIGGFIREETVRAFDLERGPLCRFTLADVGRGRHLLLFVAHRLVFDCMSKDILVRDLAACYRARAADRRPELAAPMSFADAAAAEHARVAARLGDARAFWRKRWAGPAEIVLPGQAGPARTAAAGEAVERLLGGEVRRAVAAIAGQAVATGFEVLLAAVHAVLYRYGNAEVAVAVDVATRGPATANQIGPFVNELPVISRPDPAMTFRELVRVIRGELRELYLFREVPLARAVGGIPPRAALTPVSVSYRRRGADPVFSGAAADVDWMMFNHAARNALHAQFVEGPDGLAMSLSFNPAVIGRPAVVRFAGHLLTLLRGAAAHPGARLGRALPDWGGAEPAAAPPAPGPGRGGREAGGLGPRPAGEPPVLSSGQERLWFMHQLDPDDASYNMSLVRRLRGPLDPAALATALTALAARHDTLRTAFPAEVGEPAVIIHPPAPVAVEHIDLSGHPESEDEARRLTARRVNAPFDLAAAPPWRVTLIRLGPGDHVLCIALHHIIADGWSLNVLFDDLAAFYTGAELPPLTVQFADLAWHQRQKREDSLSYWRGQLAVPPPVEGLFMIMAGSGQTLPTSGHDDETGHRRGAFWEGRVAAEVVAGLERVGQQRGATLFMVLLAAYQVLLARHCGQDDLLIGTPWAARDRAEAKPLVGYLTDVLVLRGDLTGNPPFTELVDRARRLVLDALAHREVPFERLHSELGLPRDTRRNPLLPTMLVLHDEATDGVARDRLGDLAAEQFDTGYQQAKFDLMLEAWLSSGGLHAVLGYDTAVFDAAEVAGYGERLGVLLRGIARDPDRPVSALPLLTEAERAVLTGSLSGAPGAAEVPLVTVPAMFAAAAAAAPDSPAVICGDERLSYAELDARAAALAAALRGGGVTTGDVVGVCLPRSAAAVAALLAVWRAGAAYLPLDPRYPDDRLAFLIEDSAAATVVTCADLASRLPGSATALLVEHAPQHSAPEHRAPEPWAAALPGDAAYLVYTSGSAGRPHGVLVDHGGLAARVAWMRTAYRLDPRDRVVQFASLSSDAHAEEIYPALAAGATVLLLPGGAASLPDVLRTPAGRAVTVLDVPTAHWHRLTEIIDEVAWPEPLRLVVLGGEQVRAAAVARWRARFGGRVRLVNTYGPAEATMIATACDLGARDVGRRPPIGRPVAGATGYVLDSAGGLAPPGVPGELFLGGTGLARGYPGLPALTAQRFVPDPFGPPGRRLYRTGDRARWRRDGTLELLGRLDGHRPG